MVSVAPRAFPVSALLVAAAAMAAMVAGQVFKPTIESTEDGGLTLSVRSSSSVMVSYMDSQRGEFQAVGEPRALATQDSVSAEIATQATETRDQIATMKGQLAAAVDTNVDLEKRVGSLEKLVGTLVKQLGEATKTIQDTSDSFGKYEKDTNACLGAITEATRPASCPKGDGSAPSCSNDDITGKFDASTGTVGGQGLLNGAVRTFHCNEGYTLLGSSVAVCHDKKWSTTPPTCAKFTTTTVAPTTTTPPPKDWVLVYRQHGCAMSARQVFSINEQNSNADCYSTLKASMTRYKVGGKYTFKLKHPGENIEATWSQTSDPMLTEEKVEGFKPMKVPSEYTVANSKTCGKEGIPWSSTVGGLCKSSAKVAAMDGSCGTVEFTAPDGNTKRSAGRWDWAVGVSFGGKTAAGANKPNLPMQCGVGWGTWTELYMCPVGQCS